MSECSDSAQVTQEGTASSAHAAISAEVEDVKSRLKEFESDVSDAETRLTQLHEK